MKVDFNKNVYRRLVGLAAFMLLLGTTVFHFVEKFPWIDAYYFSVVTLTTVGYGDFTPRTNFGKIFVTFYIMAGVGIITTFISYTMRRRASIAEKRMNKEK